MVTVKDLGEHKLLAKLKQYCPEEIVGDDAAILDFPSDQQLVVTTDILVENVHFSDRTTPPLAVGWRAVAANLSDLAAMGATPTGITVGLSLRPDTTLDWVEKVYQGMKKCLDQFNTPIIGGDITGAKVNVISITALGKVFPQHTIKRNLAQIGDAILITGKHGLSKAGLELLLNPQKYSSVSSVTQLKLIKAHQYPQPRFDVIHQWQQLTAQSPQPIAGMDSSDGLADAISQICYFSGVGAKIDLSAIPQETKILELTNAETALEWCLYGGEDFELVMCLPPLLAQKLIEKLDYTATIIGEIAKSKSIYFHDSINSQRKICLNPAKTYQHF